MQEQILAVLQRSTELPARKSNGFNAICRIVFPMIYSVSWLTKSDKNQSLLTVAGTAMDFNHVPLYKSAGHYSIPFQRIESLMPSCFKFLVGLLLGIPTTLLYTNYQHSVKCRLAPQSRLLFAFICVKSEYNPKIG